jgi:hypothetical protein
MDLRIKLIALGGLIIALGAFHYTDKYYAIHEAEKAVEVRLNASYKEQLNLASIKAKKTETELQTEAIKFKQDKDNEIKIVNDKLDVAISQLRTRTSRPTNYTPPSNNISTCSGSQLYREDAEFLTREAARAEAVRIERDYYFKQYEDARIKINGTSN